MLNFILCCLGGWIAVCRLAKMGSDTKPSVRAQYTIWLGALTASGWSWTIHEPATIIQILIGASIVVHMMIGFGAWRYGAPPYSLK